MTEVDVDHCCFVWILALVLLFHSGNKCFVERINVEFGDCSRKRHFEDNAEGASRPVVTPVVPLQTDKQAPVAAVASKGIYSPAAVNGRRDAHKMMCSELRIYMGSPPLLMV